MNKKDINEVKEAFKEAESSLRDKKRKKVKDLVIRTLTKIDKIDEHIKILKKEIAEQQKDRKILKMDIDDLKEGRLDRIEERQKKDKKAKKVSVFTIEKDEKNSNDNWWKQPYKIFDQPATYPSIPIPNWNDNTITYCNTGLTATTTTNGMDFIGYSSAVDFTVDNSIVKFDVTGTYDINGHIINLR